MTIVDDDSSASFFAALRFSRSLLVPKSIVTFVLSCMENPMFSIHNLLGGFEQTSATPAHQKESSDESKMKSDNKKKARTSFTKNQTAILEQRFASQKYITSLERASLAEELQMSDAQVKTWFQNRRTKWRRHESELREQHRRTLVNVLVSHCHNPCQNQ